MEVTAATVGGLIARWASVYEDNKFISASVIFVHLSGILLGGGAAIVADREALQLAGSAADRPQNLARWRGVHRWVIGGLAVTGASGVLMLLSDLKTFLPSVLYWVKMGLVLALLANGYVRLLAERKLERGGDDGLRMFKRTSVVSLVLWLAILLAGAMLSTV